MKIGIVGFGTFGQFLAKTLTKQGHAVSAASRSDYSAVAAQIGVAFFPSPKHLLNSSEFHVIIFSTSILSFPDVLRSIPLAVDRIPPPLLVDVLSVKEHPRDLLLEAAPANADVVCTHPMFGPESGKDGWMGLTFVYDKVRVRNDELCDRFLDIFRSEGCRMVEISCKEHDEMAARSQFVAHTIGRVLEEMEIKSTPIDTNGFRSLLRLRDDTVKDSFDLYLGLFKHNKFAFEQLERLEMAIQTVKTRLLQR